MKELSLNILDIAQNSVSAKASEIEITVEIGIWPYSLIAERCLFKGVGANPTRHNFM